MSRIRIKISRKSVLQICQGLAFICFVWQMAVFEERLREKLSSQQDQVFGKLIAEYLNQSQWFFLPNGFWRLFLPLAVVAAALIFFSTWRWWFMTLSGYGCVLLLLADRIYFLFFDSVIPFSSVGASGQLWKVRSSVFSTLTWNDLFIFISLFWIPLFGFFFHKHAKVTMKQDKTVFLLEKIVGIVFMALSLHAASWAYYLQNKHVVIENRHSLKVFLDRNQAPKMNFTLPYESSYRSFAAIFGVYNFHVFNFYETVREYFGSDTLEPVQLEKVVQFLKERQNLNKTESPLFGVGKSKNIVMFSLESFSTALVGLEVKGQEVTPNLNRLAKTYFYWPNIIDNARTGGTSDAEFSVLTGLLTDLQRMAAMGIAERNELRSLPLSLKGQGYGTYSFHGNEASFWNRNINHPKLGIEKMFFEESFPGEESLGLGIPDHVVFLEALEILRFSKEPYFGFVISLTSHHPFSEVPFFQDELDLSDLPDTPFKRYLKLANYTDYALGEFIDSAKERGVWKDMILVLYGDHRPPLSEKDLDLFERTCGYPLSEGRGLQIPLVVTLPGLEERFTEEKRIALETVGGLQDIFPTISHLLGIEAELGLYGVHLFTPNGLRGSFPLYKIPGAYVYNGVAYSGELGIPIVDDLGVLYVNDQGKVIQDPQFKKENFERVVNALEMHMLMFNQNAQKRAIEAVGVD